MPTPKSLRAAPPRTFEDYILTLTADFSAGLTNIPQEKFTQVPGVGGSGLTNTISSEIDIGFPLSYDGKTYQQFVVCTSGWMALVAPGFSFNYTDVMTDSADNTTIKSTFTRNHSLFAVWFDNLRNSYETPASLSLSANATSEYEKGLSQPNPKLNLRKYGIQYYKDNQSSEGRRLIIRWHSLSYYNLTNPSILEFEIVLYENGKVEYRYPPKSKLFIAPLVSEGATVGVFMPGGTYRFRDFSYEIGYRTTERSRYKFGGFISGSFNDGGGVPYGAYLNPPDNWPGNGNFGAVFTFQPPLNRRKVLPRDVRRKKDSKITLPTVARTGDFRSGKQNIIFDDRKSIVYSTKNVNFPTTLPRFYADGLPGVTENQDLFAGDFGAIGNVVANNVQDYLEDNRKEHVSPFTENKIFENDPAAADDPFFTTGTGVSDVGAGFNQSLKSKTQLRLSFRVDHKTKMFGASSSIYYFNSKTKRWQYPTSSFANGQFDIPSPYVYAVANKLIDVDRGFNAFGFTLASGSNRFISSLQSWNKQNEINSLMSSYDKSMQVDPRYTALNDESFEIPINQPFLLEKAVIELPIEAGPGWFNDKTRCFIPLTTTSPRSPDELNSSITFDMGGPGVTIALFNQVRTGLNKTKRDLILSGTFTHHQDNIAEIRFSNTPDILAGGSTNWGGGDDSGKVWQVVPQGFKAYATPTSIVTGSSNLFFTGSVKLKCQSGTANGVLVRDAFYIAQAYGGSADAGDAWIALEQLFSSSQWSLPGNKYVGYENFGPQTYSEAGQRYRTIIGIDNFGRGGSGFEPSGRSIFGREYATLQGNNATHYDNPFYLHQDGNTLASLKSIVNANVGAADAVIYASSIIPRQKSLVSPYLLFPGDRLVLSVSKTRPVFFSTLTSQPYTSGSIEHDIKLTTGSINITLYGSLVANGREFHDTLNQPLSSDAVHEVVIGGTKTW